MLMKSTPRYSWSASIYLAVIGVGLLLTACESSTEKGGQALNSPPPSESATATSSSLKPPYPIEDSSKIQEVEGIQLYLVEAGNGAIPTPSSNVVINYHGYLPDGKVFDSSFDKDGLVDFRLAQLIKGWQIGLSHIRSGSKVKLIVPPELGYGAAGSPPNIPPNATLIFDIELITTYEP